MSSPIHFTEVCALIDLSDLAVESNCNIIDTTTDHNPVSIKTKSDYYPINSRGRNMDNWWKEICPN